MKMPSRIWAWPWEPSPSRGQWQMADHRNSLDTPYIRADIAEELALALEEFGEYENWMAERWRAALDRYRNATAD